MTVGMLEIIRINKALAENSIDSQNMKGTPSKSGTMRIGQRLFNELPDELYRELSHTEYDCFYDDSKFATAYVHVIDILSTRQEYCEEIK